ncbi:hypothetical protein JYT19_00390 [Sulfobacillus acidophilus]|uniref:Phosphoenolpyruvate synthase n=1 Tax=Sulfobacillus acidophilus TaxID=53633 RepID=A0ABS3AVV0_9FIRM|nr:hypothetical protein [Sulfobacillus acidophilus]
MALENILLPSEITDLKKDFIGGKAFGLHQLQKNQSNTPPWFVLTNTSFENHLLQNNIFDTLKKSLLNANKSNLSQVSKNARELILKTKLNNELKSTLVGILPKIGNAPFAIRSSMVGEDSKSHSFAGQLESFLHQHTLDDLEESILKCWASAFSARVLKYKLQAKQKLCMPKMGVIVQKMLSSQVSGVLFTANPLSGNQSQCLLSAAWGQGEGIVSGECNTDEFVYHHTNGEISFTIAQKDLQILPAEINGLKQFPVSLEKQNIRCLSKEQVSDICSQGISFAKKFNQPLDIEWSIENGQIHFLQARPITKLPKAQNQDGPKIVFDNSNIQESYCGVTTPLTFSFATSAYASVYEQTMRAVYISQRTINEHKKTLENLLGLIHGRIYYNINNWYKGLLLLPSFGKNKEDMEKMMGLQDPVDFIVDNNFSLFQKLKKFPRLFLTFCLAKRKFSHIFYLVKEFTNNFEKSYKEFNRNELKNLTFSQLMQKLEFLRLYFLQKWHTPIVNDFYVMMSMGKLRRVISRSGIKNADETLANLLCGEDGIESTEPTHTLMRLANEIRKNHNLKLLFAKDNSIIEKELKQESISLWEKIETYVERYGDRCAGELKLETISLREDRSFIYNILKAYIKREHLDPKVLLRQEKKKRKETEDILRESLGTFDSLKLGKTLYNARLSVKNRENMRLARTRLFGLYRDVYKTIGLKLEQAGMLNNHRDIFYLTVDEIESYHEGRSVNANLKAIAEVRKNEFQNYQKMDLPHHFETIGPVYHGNSYEAKQDLSENVKTDNLKGTGCYPGIVKAPIKVVLDPNENIDLSGKILVTLRTDPGWAPLFPSCSGIIVERGSTLSHSAIVARELGIPAIVGVKNLLKIIKDGQLVQMNGATGNVEIIKTE